MRSISASRNLSREQRAVLARIQQICEFWDIEPNELHGQHTPVVEKPVVPVSTIKYRHPVTGETWNGEGAHPEWLRQALLKEGYRVAELVPG